MTFESGAAFSAASAVLLIIPGPTVLLVVSYALGQGWRTVLPMTVGVALGDFTAMTLSMLGLGALRAASATLFTVLKWISAAYLVYLGVKLLEHASGTLEAAPRTDAVSGRPHAGPCLAGDGAQPQSIHFYRRLPAASSIRGPTSSPRCSWSGPRSCCWPLRQCLRLRAGRHRARGFVADPRAISMVDKVGGGLLIGAGAATVTFAGSRS